MKKRFFAMFLATAMALSLVSISAANVSVSSTASNPKTDISPKTASEIVALSFMKNSLNSNIEISETTPFYDLDGNITAYCVSFHLSQEPKGYVLISLLTSEDPIVEFSFEGPGLVDTIQRSTQSKLSRTPTINSNFETSPIYYLGAGALFLQDSSNSYLYDVFQILILITIVLHLRYLLIHFPLQTESLIGQTQALTLIPSIRLLVLEMDRTTGL